MFIYKCASITLCSNDAILLYLIGAIRHNIITVIVYSSHCYMYYNFVNILNSIGLEQTVVARYPYRTYIRDVINVVTVRM